MKTLQEFQTWAAKVQQSGGKLEQLQFVWELMRTPYTEYYYSLITDKKTNDEFRSYLWSRFNEHGEKAAQLLLSKLERNEDTDFHGAIIFCLGKLADGRTIGKKGLEKEKEKTREWASKLADDPNAWLRDPAITVLGWIGQDDDIPQLARHLLDDPDAKCRAWSATSFMQMWFRRKRLAGHLPDGGTAASYKIWLRQKTHESQALVDKTLPILRQALQRETDYFAIACIIDVVQQLTQKRFGLAQKHIDQLEKDKIDQAKTKAQRFLDKLHEKQK